MSIGVEYDPLKWPPEISLAQMHYSCSKPGIDNPEGARCPCCSRFQKLENSKWPSRDIAKDFKNYGGGVPGYFYLVIYMIVILIVLAIVKAVYQIMLIEGTCKYIAQTYKQKGQSPFIQCSQFFGVKFLDSSILFAQLEMAGKGSAVAILQYLQFATYLILVFSTVGIKIFLQRINKDRISLDQKLFSRFSLIIKNVPLYYQLDDLKEELRAIDPKIQIQEMFYLHKASQYTAAYKKLFDLYYELAHLEQGIQSDQRQKKMTELRKKYQQYLNLHDEVTTLSQSLHRNSKKILVVFNTIQQKQKVHKALKMNQGLKTLHYISRMLGMKSDPISYYSERIAQPQEIHWNNIGESSTHKQKVRIETTFIGIAFMLISFALFYFPMYKIDEEKVAKPALGTALGFIISLLIIILSVVYRQVIVGLMPKRRPSSKLAESYFIVMTIIIFHFFFFLVTPASFYVLAQVIPQNMKLKQFFTTILTFSILSIIIALLDLSYRLTKGRRQRLLNQPSQANRYCQQRLHEQVSPPSFPLQFKLMVTFNLWSFNSFYIFQVPYLIFFFLIVLIIVYWVDKYNLYRHYKQQIYMSIQLQIKIQKTYIIFFLICASFGYYFSVQTLWEHIAIAVVVVVALALNFGLNYTYKKQKDSILKHNTDLKSAIQNCKSSIGQNMHLQMLEKEFKSSFLVAPDDIDFSSVSLASEVASYGYLETYNLFLNQFKNKRLNNLLQEKCISIRHSKTILDGKKRHESQLVRLDDGLQHPLLGSEQIVLVKEGDGEKIEEYVPPPAIVVIEPVKNQKPKEEEREERERSEASRQE